ncbi:MAG: hypothetical protein WCH93_10810 [Actinomycetota bacterium]
MKLQNVASRVASVALVLALGAVVSCSAERAGVITSSTTPPISVTIGACAPAAGVTVVNWSGVSTRSVRVEYRDSSGQAAQSSWKNLAKAVASGSANVTTPAAALSGLWTVWAVTLAPNSNGGGTDLFTREFADCGIVTTQTIAPDPTTTVK